MSFTPLHRLFSCFSDFFLGRARNPVQESSLSLLLALRCRPRLRAPKNYQQESRFDLLLALRCRRTLRAPKNYRQESSFDLLLGFGLGRRRLCLYYPKLTRRQRIFLREGGLGHHTAFCRDCEGYRILCMGSEGIGQWCGIDYHPLDKGFNL